MPLRDHMKLISTDDHIIEHRDVWQSRLPAHCRDQGPKVIEIKGKATNELGGSTDTSHNEVWTYEGDVYPNIALNAVAGRPREEYGLDPVRFDQMRPGCYDPTARVSDMDLDGVQAQLGFPTFPGFGGKTFLGRKDPDLALLCVQAYNDFVIDEWCGSHPDRLIPMTIVPLWDPDLSAREALRCAEKGSKAISFLENPAGLGLPSFHSDHWNPLLAVAEEANLPLCLHFGTSNRGPFVASDASFAVTIALMGTNSLSAVVDLLFSPVFHSFPRLKVALSEGGIGWIPWLLERMDYTWERHRLYTGINVDVRPSDLFREHIYGCFIDDEVGIELRNRIGIDQITWEGDYPHSDSPWPGARKRVAEMLEDVPDEEVHKIVELNARKLLNFDADIS